MLRCQINFNFERGSESFGSKSCCRCVANHRSLDKQNGQSDDKAERWLNDNDDGDDGDSGDDAR